MATVLTVNAEPRATDGVWGLILLGKTRPDNAMVCDHFYSAFPLAQHPMDEHRFILRPTYWPDRRRASELPKQTNCGDLVTNYDWIWTNAILNQLGRDGVAGPVLVGYGPAPNAPGMLTRTILDLSDWPTSELALGFAKWTQTITSYPSDWRGVTFAETLRLGLRNFLIVHGDSLFAAVINPGELVQRAYADSPRDGQHQSPQLVEIDLSQ